ncbi:hypothetical protein [Streptomyces sp. NPDC058297]|uniref:hypothetical protein n=1 Tax=Streptomyces sp. NPDC058297 TaxID=3346433 RepID=UPI0036EEA410
MKRYAWHVWHTVRGTLLAVLGVVAAYALAQVLDPLGLGLLWQAGLGLAAFTATVLATGVVAFRMDAEGAVEETAHAVRTAWHYLMAALDALHALFTGGDADHAHA